MSQYSFYLAKQKHAKSIFNTYFLRRHFEHQGYELDRVFQIPDQSNRYTDLLVRFFRKVIYTRHNKYKRVFSYTGQFALKLFNMHYVLENNNYHYEERLLKQKGGIHLYLGGWHSEKYYREIEKEIKETFRFREDKINEGTKQIKAMIESKNSVSLHIRRGDFLSEANKDIYGNVCTLDYYNRAIQKIKEQIPSPYFFVFSNDIEWTKENLLLDNVYFVNCNTGNDSWQDMYLMSCCKHNITANSTFSWWGAWLNSNPNKLVICPQTIKKNVDSPDFYPASWSKI